MCIIYEYIKFILTLTYLYIYTYYIYIYIYIYNIYTGEITAFGLEVLVVSDILETIEKDVEEYSFPLLGKKCSVV